MFSSSAPAATTARPFVNPTGTPADQAALRRLVERAQARRAAEQEEKRPHLVVQQTRLFSDQIKEEIRAASNRARADFLREVVLLDASMIALEKRLDALIGLLERAN